MVDIDGATTATIATGDKVNFLDITDSLVKEDTVQGILDLAAGGATVLVGTHERTSAGASLDVTGIDSTYDTYLVYGTDIVPGTDNTDIYFRVGDSSGFDSGASDYCWDTVQNELAGTSWAQTGDEDNADSQIAMNSFIQHAAGSGTSETVSIFLTLQGMGDSPGFPNIRGDQFLYNKNGGCTFGYHYR
jgi:hypothetical protein